MPFDKTLFAAIAALALTAGCSKQEERISTVPPPPPATAQPPEPIPSPQAGTATPGTADAGRTVGQTVDDATVTVKVKAKLLESPEVNGLTVNVDTVNGTVILKGEVESPAQAERAVQIARNTEGVKEVDNQLMVKARS